jgi:signal transduction histidine kinase
LRIGDGGPVSLFDADGATLASLREDGDSAGRSQGKIDIGSPAVARLVGDVASMDPEFVERVTGLVLSVVDFDAEMDELSRHALERYRELSLLYDFSEKASSTTALSDIMSFVLRKAVSVVHASGASLISWNPETKKFRLVTSVGIVPEVPNDQIARVVESGRTWVGMTGFSLREVTGDSWNGTLACVPLRSADRASGVLVVLAGPGRELRPEDQRLLTALASLAALRLDLAGVVEAAARKREVTVLGHVATTLVHDFKNPLTAIRGYAEMIQMPEIPADEHSSLAEQIIVNADRLWGMAEEILHFARGNQASLDLKPTTGEQLAQRLTATLQHTVPPRIELTVRLQELGRIVVDTQKLERVIVNLVRNACEAIIGRGKVTVRASVSEKEASIIVEDDGPGIPPGIKNTLFEPFVTIGKPGGTGLGLAIVKKIIEDHRGTITVHSEPGGGARFILTLPQQDGASGE